MSKNLKMKDMVHIALLTAIYIIIYMISMTGFSFLGQFGHTISPGIAAFFTGAIIIFMNRKIGKMWEFTLFTLLVMGVFAMVGGGYIPWVITSVTGAVIADILASRSRETSIFILAISWGIIHVGQAFGSIVPANFFVESFRTHGIERGMNPKDMDLQISYARGVVGLMSTVGIFILAFVGVYLGYLILRKHLERQA